ncbi:MAG: hypothetical protein ABJO01_05840 [Parasphingorhabdus sp.]
MNYSFGILSVIAIAGGIFYRLWMLLPDGPTGVAVGEQKMVQRGDRSVAF